MPPLKMPRAQIAGQLRACLRSSPIDASEAREILLVAHALSLDPVEMYREAMAAAGEAYGPFPSLAHVLPASVSRQIPPHAKPATMAPASTEDDHVAGSDGTNSPTERADLARALVESLERTMATPQTLVHGDNDASQHYERAIAFERGVGVKRDRHEAIRLYGRAAVQGHAAAQCRLGVLAMFEGDYGKAGRWLLLAELNGDRDARTLAELAVVHSEPATLAAMDEAARRGWWTPVFAWFVRAADEGDGEAAFHAGRLLEDFSISEGVESAHGAERACPVYWWLRAAELGNPWGASRLGDAYLHGNGVAQDRRQAYYWYHRAASSGDEFTDEMLTVARALRDAGESAHALTWLRNAVEAATRTGDSATAAEATAEIERLRSASRPHAPNAISSDLDAARLSAVLKRVWPIIVAYSQVVAASGGGAGVPYLLASLPCRKDTIRQAILEWLTMLKEHATRDAIAVHWPERQGELTSAGTVESLIVQYLLLPWFISEADAEIVRDVVAERVDAQGLQKVALAAAIVKVVRGEQLQLEADLIRLGYPIRGQGA